MYKHQERKIKRRKPNTFNSWWYT